MQRWAKLMLKKNETYIFLIIVLVCVLIELRSGQFFTVNNLVDLCAAMIVPGLFAIGTYVVIISGGIDISFTALASLNSYIIIKSLNEAGYKGSLLLPVIMAVVLGAVFGALNGFLIAKFKFPALIVTLATQSIFKGVMQGALGAVQLYEVPEAMEHFGYASLFVVKNPQSGLMSKMPVALLVLIAVIVFTFLLLRYTMFGRGIFAVGGSETSAERAGFNVFWTKVFVYVFAGVVGSIAGMIRMSMIAQFQPTNMMGMEMTIIASVVLGGTAITGGRGSITGVLLGTFLLVLVENSLLLIGVPTFWQKFFLGMLIIIGTGISAVQVYKNSNKLVGLKDFSETEKG